jgi:hypothetical protein
MKAAGFSDLNMSTTDGLLNQNTRDRVETPQVVTALVEYLNLAVKRIPCIKPLFVRGPPTLLAILYAQRLHTVEKTG